MSTRRAVWGQRQVRFKPRVWRTFACTVLCLSLILLSGCERGAAEIAELHGETMGTTFSVQLTPAPPVSEQQRLQAAIIQRLDAINAVMSTYLPDSAISAFNRSQSTDWQTQPRELVALVAQARSVSEATAGRYDITVGPLIELWGFGASGRRAEPPTADAIATRLADVGYRSLDIRDEPPALRKASPGLQIDLSSIAKGWAVDEISGFLDNQGFGNHLVEIGGELISKGRKASDRPWRVAVERPHVNSRIVQRVVPISDLAMASSGDYRNFFEADGERYSHTIDPSTGASVRHRLAAVSVFAASCSYADAWATALMALGDEDGPALADALGIQALFLVRRGDDIEERASTALQGATFWSESHLP